MIPNGSTWFPNGLKWLSNGPKWFHKCPNDIQMVPNEPQVFLNNFQWSQMISKLSQIIFNWSNWTIDTRVGAVDFWFCFSLTDYTGGLNNISLYYSREMNCNIKFYPLCCLEIPDEGRFPNMFYVGLLTITIYWIFVNNHYILNL